MAQLSSSLFVLSTQLCFLSPPSLPRKRACQAFSPTKYTGTLGLWENEILSVASSAYLFSPSCRRRWRRTVLLCLAANYKDQQE